MLRLQVRTFAAGVRGPAIDLEAAPEATVASVKARLAGLSAHPVAAAPEAAALVLVAPSGALRTRLDSARSLAEQGVATDALLRLVSLRELAEDEAAVAAVAAKDEASSHTATRRALADASAAASAVLNTYEFMSTLGRRHAAAAAAAAAKALEDHPLEGAQQAGAAGAPAGVAATFVCC